MTTGTIALLAWFRQSTSGGPSMTNTMTSGPSTTRRRNAPPRKYVIHTRRTCFKCKQEGHYARDCPRITDQRPTKTKMEKMQTLLRSMTTTERAELKRHILNIKDKLRTKTTNTLLSRETSPHTDRTFTGTLPSRETNPDISRAPRQSTKAPERCGKCDGAHPTCICMKQFLKPRKRELTAPPAHDDSSMEGDTLCDPEGLENGETELTTNPSTCPVKTITSDLLNDELTKNDTPCHADESENDDGNDGDSSNIQQPTSQNDEADTRLVRAVWLRKTSDNVYMSN